MCGGLSYTPAGSPDISAAGLPGVGPAGSRYLCDQPSVSRLKSIAQCISIIPHVQNWDNGEFRLQWTWDVHGPMYLEEHVHRVVDLV